MTIALVTGFEPFAEFPVNSSWEAAVRLDGETVAGATIRAVRLPVEYGGAFDRVRAAVEASDPALVLLTGLAPSPAVRVEAIAVNANAEDMADNAGVRLRQPIDPDGPPAYWSHLPVDAVQQALEGNGVPAVVSYSAGLYVCNDVFYRFLAFAEARQGRPRGGFLHVPPLPAEGGPGLELDRTVAALRIALSTALSA